jgi:hypothetical protein
VSARLLAPRGAQALGLALEAVTAGRLTAGVAVPGQPRLELLHAREQRGNLLALALVLGLSFGDAVLSRHGSLRHPLRKSA